MFVQRECLFYLLVLVVVSILGKMGLAQGDMFYDSPGNNIASIFVSITFILTTYFDNVLLSKDLD